MAEDKKEEKGSRKRLIILFVGLMALVVIGAGGFLLRNNLIGLNKATADTEQHEQLAEAKGHEGREAARPHDIGEIFELEPFIVNLQDNTGSRYLKVSIHLELDPMTLEEAKLRTAQIRDAIIILLSSKSYADVGTVQGKYQLRDEIMARVNHILTGGKVRNVYFTEFVIQ